MLELKHLLTRCGPLEKLTLSFRGEEHSLIDPSPLPILVDTLLSEGSDEKSNHPALFRGPHGELAVPLDETAALLAEIEIARGRALHFAFKDKIPVLLSTDLPIILPDFHPHVLENLPENERRIAGYILNGSGILSSRILYALLRRRSHSVLVVRSQNLLGAVILAGNPKTRFFIEDLTEKDDHLTPSGFMDLLLVSSILTHTSPEPIVPLESFMLFDNGKGNLLAWICLRGRENY